jgi:hypothetical protein
MNMRTLVSYVGRLHTGGREREAENTMNVMKLAERNLVVAASWVMPILSHGHARPWRM